MGGVGGEGVASGEGGSGWVRGWRMEIFFVFFKKKTKNTNFHLMDPKTNKKRKCETKTKIKNPLPEDFFFLDTNCFVSCHVLISILTQCVV